MLRDGSASGDESTVKWINSEPKLFQGHRSKEDEAVRRSHEAWGGRFFSSQGHDDVSKLPDFLSAIRQDNRAFSRWEASHGMEDRTGNHRIRGPGIHQEAEFLTLRRSVSRPDADADRKLSHAFNLPQPHGNWTCAKSCSSSSEEREEGRRQTDGRTTPRPEGAAG